MNCFSHSLTELSISWEAANCAATQELYSILWNLKFHYRVHKTPPLVPILSQINSIHTIPCYLRSILIWSTHLCLGLPSGLFPSGFPTNILYAFIFSPICATCPAHLILLDLIILMFFSLEVEITYSRAYRDRWYTYFFSSSLLPHVGACSRFGA
jgi:hypothetical protein